MEYRNIVENKGFTLVELAVVIFIILLLTAVTLPNYRSGEKRLALQRSANKLAQDIRRVQGMAMSAEEFHGIVPEGGYGIRVRDKHGSPPIYTYFLYADCNNNEVYDGVIVDAADLSNPLNPDQGCTEGVDCPCDCPGNCYSEKMEEIRVEKGVMTGLGSDWVLVENRILFIPPDPVVIIRCGYCDPSSPCLECSRDSLTATVSLEANPSEIKTIKVNKAGLIEVE